PAREGSPVPGPDAWPGELRRNPPASSPTFAVRAPLAAWLRRQADARSAPYRVLDVGCGVKPYYPFFRPYASEYVGVDVVENPAADLQGAVESLPAEDGSFDLVLCIQVLEHAEDPAQGVRELRRVVAPGGPAGAAGQNPGAPALTRLSFDLSEPRPGSLIANYHVVAEP